MSQAIVYFGAPAKDANSTSEEAKTLGLEFIRESPSKVNTTVALDYKQPGYVIFKAFLPKFIYVAKNSTATAPIRISTRTPPYHPVSHTTLPPFVKLPTLIWSYNNKLNPEQIDEVKTKFGAIETVAKGKLAFKAPIQDATWLKLLKEGSPVQVTPSGTGEINLASFSTYLVLGRLIDLFCRTNQYPAFKDHDKSHVGRFRIRLQEPDVTSIADVTLDNGDTVKDLANTTDDPNMVIYCNLATSFDTYSYVAHTDAHIPTGYTGLVFSYQKALTKTDYVVVPRVIQRYFMGSIGGNSAQALSNFDTIKSGWGNICKTPWGDVLAHAFRMIELALDTQTIIKFISPPSGLYEGAVLLGGAYTLTVHGKQFRAVERSELITALALSVPHTASLTYIFSKIHYDTQANRVISQGTVMNIRDINFLIRTKGIIESFRSEIIRKAFHLKFPGELPFLTPSAHNISTVLHAISDETIPESNFPLHPEAIAADTRAHRLLSSFGMECPSFLVTGGKSMELEKRFSVREQDGNKVWSDRDITKLGVIFVGWKKACTDFDTVRERKHILNPYGSQIASRVSTQTTIRTYEKESAFAILAALRSAVGAVQRAEGGGKRQRDVDDEDVRQAKKGAKIFDDDTF